MKTWKSGIALLLAVCLLLCLCGCGGGSASSSGTGFGAPASGAPASSAPAQAAPQQPASSAPAAPEAAPPAAPPAESTPALPAAQPLALQKQLYGQYDWEDDDLLVQSEYSHITLWYEDAEAYPQLAEVLEQTAAMVVRSMEDEYDNLSATAREELAALGFAPETAVSTLDIQVRRADSVAVSLLSDSYADFGWIEGFRGMHGANYDTQTGRQLMLDEVVDVNNDLAEAVEKELTSHMWAGDFYTDSAVEDYFANTPYDAFSWTLDYNGVTFYFADGELCEPGNGRQTATVAYAAYPELFNEKYFSVPEAYAVRLPLDSSFFVDLDGDNDLEELIMTGYYSPDVGFYSQFGIYTDIDGRYHYLDRYASKFVPYYVKTADDNHYIYFFCWLDEGFIPCFSLLVFDLAGGQLTSVGELPLGPGYIPDGIYRLPTNPEWFYLDDFEGLAQDAMPYTVGPDGLPHCNEP